MDDSYGLYWDVKNCKCRWLCPSGHLRYDKVNNLTGCTFYGTIIRHAQINDGEQFEICHCNNRCSGCRSAGLVSVKIVNGKPVIMSFLS